MRLGNRAAQAFRLRLIAARLEVDVQDLIPVLSRHSLQILRGTQKRLILSSEREALPNPPQDIRVAPRSRAVSKVSITMSKNSCTVHDPDPEKFSGCGTVRFSPLSGANHQHGKAPNTPRS